MDKKIEFKLVTKKKFLTKSLRRLVEEDQKVLPQHWKGAKHNFIGIMQGNNLVSFIIFLRNKDEASIRFMETKPVYKIYTKRTQNNLNFDRISPKVLGNFVRNFRVSPARYLLDELTRRGVKKLTKSGLTFEGKRMVAFMQKKGILRKYKEKKRITYLYTQKGKAKLQKRPKI